MKRGLVIRLDDTVTDNTLFKLNEVRIPLSFKSTTISAIVVQTKNDTVKLSLLDNMGTFYSDLTGSSSLGTSVSLATGKNTLYAKITKDGDLSIENFESVIGLGGTGQWNEINRFIGDSSAFIATINVEDMIWNTNLECFNTGAATSFKAITDMSLFSNFPNLKCLIVPSGSILGGNLSGLSESLYVLNCNSSYVEFNLNYINRAKVANDVSLQINSAKSIRYTGSSDLRFPVCNYFVCTGSDIPTDELDNLLISLAQSTWRGNKTLTLQGKRSSDSDAAIAALENQGVTVKVI